MSNKRVRKFGYEFRDGKTVAGLSADTVGGELDRIHRENGVLTAPAVVDAARPEDSVIHPAFTWDDFAAAEEHRRWQARQLIRAVVVKSPEGEKDQKWVHVAVKDQKVSDGYQPVSVVVNSPSMFASAISELTNRVNAAKASLDGLVRAAREDPDTDSERMARISMAVSALNTAGAAVQALH